MPWRSQTGATTWSKCSAATRRLTTAWSGRLRHRRCWTRSWIDMAAICVVNTHCQERLARRLPDRGTPSSTGDVNMLWHRGIRRAAARALLALCGALALSACGAHYAQVPARLALQPYGRVALVSFTT